MDAYLSKPLDPDALGSLLEEMTGSRPLENTDAPPADPGNRPLDPKVLNDLRLLDRDGDGSFLREVVAAYVEDTERRLAELRTGVAAADRPAVARNAHTLKGSSRNIGAERMAKLCEALEAETADASPAILSRMEEEFVGVKAALAHEMDLAS